MSKAKHYTPDRLILHGLAADHLRDNRDTSHQQLMQLFALTTLEARDVRRAVASGEAVSGATMKAATAWAIENMAGNTQIENRFNMSEGNARRVALSAKRANAEKIAAAKAQLDVAVKYAAENPFETVKSIAAKFGVSPHSVERSRRVRRRITAAVEIGSEAATAAPPKPKNNGGNRLYAVLPDGSIVDPRKCRSVGDGVRFMGVAV